MNARVRLELRMGIIALRQQGLSSEMRLLTLAAARLKLEAAAALCVYFPDRWPATSKLNSYELSGGAWVTRGYRIGGHPGVWTTAALHLPGSDTARF